MLRDVNTHVSDGLLGFSTATGDGVHIKIGASPITSERPIIITGDMDAAKIKARLGLSPLTDAAMDSVQSGAAKIYCIPVSAATAGTVGEVSKSGKGGGALTVTGAPTNAFSVVVRVTASGEPNTAAFMSSIDGGFTFSDEATVPLTGEYALEGTGLTLHFAEKTDEKYLNSFAVEDEYAFSTTAPTMTNGEVLAAIEQLRQFNQEFEFVHIVGASEPPLWLAVSEAQKELMSLYHKPAFFLLEAAFPTMDSDGSGGIYDWAAQMESDRKQVANTDIQVCAAWGRIIRLDGRTQNANLAGLVAGRYAKAPVQESIGKTRLEAGYGFSKARIAELIPAGYNNAVIELLDTAKYLTFREYDGLSDTYVYHTKMMCPDGSDYRYAEDVRVRNKIIREVRKKGLLLKNDDIDLEDLQGELEARAKYVSIPLDRMVEQKEISSYKTTVLPGHEETFLDDETLRLKVRYLSRGYIREVDIDIGRAPIT